MKTYPKNSTLTIRERLEQLSARAKSDYLVKIYDNSTEWRPENFMFYIDDYEDYKNSEVFDYRLDTEKKYKGTLCLGFTHIKGREE